MKEETMRKRMKELNRKISLINDNIDLSFTVEDILTNNPKYDFWINGNHVFIGKTLKEAELIIETLIAL